MRLLPEFRQNRLYQNTAYRYEYLKYGIEFVAVNRSATTERHRSEYNIKMGFLKEIG